MIDHFECSRHMFYQLALWRFAQGTNIANFKQPIDIAQVIGQMLQLEETLTHCCRDDHDDDGSNDNDDDTNNNSEQEQLLRSGEPLPVSETNQLLAGQAAECLLLNAAMLKEYFSIVIERDNSEDGSEEEEEEEEEKQQQNGALQPILLKGLPVLLDGCAPQLHALPLFLLKLATEVDYEEERPCFHGVCRELGHYYATAPHGEENLLPHVRHVLFPALSSLLVPTKKLAESESAFVVLTQLSKLYQVFERC